VTVTARARDESTAARVDVVIVAYRSATTLGGCIAAAQRIEDAGRIVVVDHGDDGSDALARRAGATVLVDTANPGFGAGQNRGRATASAPYVLLLNPDAEPERAAIAAGVRYLDEHRRVAAVQGVVLDRATGEPDRSQGSELGVVHLIGRALGARRLHTSRMARRLARWFAPTRDHIERVPARATAVESLAATAWLARRSALDEVDGFDESYFLYGEDLDLCRRLRAAKWDLVALPVPWAMHAQGGSAASTFERELTWWTGTLRFAARWWSTPRWIGSLVAAMLRWLGLAASHPSAARRAWRATVGAGMEARFSRPSAGRSATP